MAEDRAHALRHRIRPIGGELVEGMQPIGARRARREKLRMAFGDPHGSEAEHAADQRIDPASRLGRRLARRGMIPLQMLGRPHRGGEWDADRLPFADAGLHVGGEFNARYIADQLRDRFLRNRIVQPVEPVQPHLAASPVRPGPIMRGLGETVQRLGGSSRHRKSWVWIGDHVKSVAEV